MSYYKNTPVYRMNTQECDSVSTGRFQFSCKYIEVGSIDGYLSVDDQRDLRWPKLEKYWNNTSRYLKFAGIACARAVELADAKQSAMDASYALVAQIIQGFEEETFTGRLAGAGYRKVDGGFNCVQVPYTGDGAGASAPVSRAQPPPAAAQQRAQSPDSANNNTATFIIHNADRYRIGLEFYSVKTNRAWPGGNRQYNLSGTETYRLSCRPGEKICFGAWRDYQIIYWGVGRNNKYGCKGCCTTCGYTLETTLDDGGPDSYPATASRSSGSDLVSNVIDAIGLGIGIASAVQGSSGGSGSVSTGSGAAPRGPDWRPSGISGGRR